MTNAAVDPVAEAWEEHDDMINTRSGKRKTKTSKKDSGNGQLLPGTLRCCEQRYVCLLAEPWTRGKIT